jgi:hypothetical protein
MVLHIPYGGGLIALGTWSWTFMSWGYPLAFCRRRSPLGAEVVTAYVSHPGSLSFVLPSRLRMLFAFFRVSSPPLLRRFLGRSSPSSWSFASLLFPRTQFSLDSKLGRGRFYFGLESAGCFDSGPALSFCSIGVVCSEGLRTYCLILVFAFAVCVFPMVSFYSIIMYFGL